MFLEWTRFQRSEYLIGRKQYKWYDALVSVTTLRLVFVCTHFKLMPFLIKLINKTKFNLLIVFCSMNIVTFLYVSCYFFFQLDCRRRRGTLVEIESSAEDDFINSLAKAELAGQFSLKIRFLSKQIQNFIKV